MSLQIVQTVVQELQALGISIEGDEGQFEVTKRVAWQLRNSGIGLRKKPDGINYRGYSVDVVLDSTTWKEYDVLVDGGLSTATPSWNFTGCVRNASYFAAPFDPSSETPSNHDYGTGGDCSGASGTTSNLGVGGVALGYLPRQCGLLEDEIMYRLTLLAEHVYLPIKTRFPNAQVLEGFRFENTAKSQHERGEALDISFPGFSNDETYAALKWIRDNVAYDQMIWCHSLNAAMLTWLHITFTPTGRRRQVLTKDHSDVFHDGLHLFVPYSDMNLRNRDLSEYEVNRRYAENFVKSQTTRTNRMNPVNVNTPDRSTFGDKQTGTKVDPMTGLPIVFVQRFGGYASEVHSAAEAVKREFPEYWEAQLSSDARGDLRFIEELRSRLSFRAYLSGSGGGSSTNWSNEQLLVPGNPTGSPNSQSAAPEDCLELYDCITNAGIDEAKIGWSWHGEDNTGPLNPKDWP